jgi:hypothetical protein
LRAKRSAFTSTPRRDQRGAGRRPPACRRSLLPVPRLPPRVGTPATAPLPRRRQRCPWPLRLYPKSLYGRRTRLMSTRRAMTGWPVTAAPAQEHPTKRGPLGGGRPSPGTPGSGLRAAPVELRANCVKEDDLVDSGIGVPDPPRPIAGVVKDQLCSSRTAMSTRGPSESPSSWSGTRMAS